jgi:hypothetical protein
MIFIFILRSFVAEGEYRKEKLRKETRDAHFMWSLRNCIKLFPKINSSNKNSIFFLDEFICSKKKNL